MSSTNTDLYLYDLNSGKTTNLTEGMMGYDQNQVISPNGELMAWESMERDGYEADKIRLFVMNLKTGEKKNTRKISIKMSEACLGQMITPSISSRIITLQMKFTS